MFHRDFSVQKLPRKANKMLLKQMEDVINQREISVEINSKSQLNTVY